MFAKLKPLRAPMPVVMLLTLLLLGVRLGLGLQDEFLSGAGYVLASVVLVVALVDWRMTWKDDFGIAAMALLAALAIFAGEGFIASPVTFFMICSAFFLALTGWEKRAESRR